MERKPTTEAEQQSLYEIGQRIRALRKRAGQSKLGLARDSGLSRGYIDEIEQRGANLSLTNLLSIAHALGVKVSELFGDEV